MKRSRAIQLALVPAMSAAAMAAGCGSGTSSQAQQVCIDGARTVVEQQRCKDDEQRSHTAGYVPMYHWYYYPYGGWTPMMGAQAPAGGSFTRPSSSFASSSSVVRGGFGSTAAGSSSAS